jgi:hypothetical protein
VGQGDQIGGHQGELIHFSAMPERHYMRGPGPKWYAKHRPASSVPDSLGVLQQS